MKANALRKKIADGVNCVGGWVAIPNAFATEVYATQGWDCVTIDMQHGARDINDIVPGKAQGVADLVLQSKARVICANRNFHGEL